MTGPRVLHVFKYFRPAFTGEGVFVERLAAVMQRLRPDVAHDVLVTATPRPDAAVEVRGLSQIHYLTGAGGPASQAALVGWLARHGSSYRVVHHHTHVDRTFLGALWLKARGQRIILSATLDDSVPGLLQTYRPLLRPLVRRLFRLIDLFVAISPKLLEQNRHVLPERSVMVPIGIPLPPDPAPERAAVRRRLGLPIDAEVMVCVGGLCARKDQLFLIRQLCDLLREDARRRLLLVGPPVEPAYEAALKREVGRLGLHEQIRFAGYAEPGPYYEAADLFVFASREEGFGTVVIEAMAHGLPVVVRRLPGVNDDIIEAGRTGFLFDDASLFDEQVRRLLDDRALARAVGEAGRAAVRRRYAIDAIAAQYLDLYGQPAKRPQ